jgi:putative SOS response-associated peptidase YedK
MPVIAVPKDYDRWMDPSTAPPLDLLRPYAANQMRAWPVGEQVGNVRNNSSSLLDEVQENQQLLFS